MALIHTEPQYIKRRILVSKSDPKNVFTVDFEKKQIYISRLLINGEF